jgi:mannose-6-phosphate isomerase-like protein (cupin superfamily)
MKHTSLVAAVVFGWFLSVPAVAQQPLLVKPLVEKKVTQLPSGPLFWRIETFGTRAEAQTAAGPTGLVAETGGKVWLFTLGPAGDKASAGGTKIAEIGPVADLIATEYLLRVNEASGSPGSITSVHTHPGSEVFYVLAGETSQRTPHGVSRVGAGQSMAGHGPNTPMQVSSSGSVDLHSLALFVVDATKPFSSPAKFE